MSLVTSLIYRRRLPLLGRLVRELLALYGVEVPAAAEIGPELKVYHRGFGTVLHPYTTLGRGVTLYNGVTIGRADPWVPQEASAMERIVLEDDVVVCAGAKVLCKRGVLTVGAGTVIGANAVLTRSTGADEIWAGAPARLVGRRTDRTAGPHPHPAPEPALRT
ncbi:serine O-acetyltransferase [Kitasatospora sp. LaBMicrA B282]|uniref:serine O-acetyltransferase n=1 Tax=Kitasatospora sp. LaBMicrA B282 TaxID=3420949 RepID=UPI003D150300